jgi:hypothetical protein
MADIDLHQKGRLREVIDAFADMTPHQRFITVRALWVLFELDKQQEAERPRRLKEKT